MAQDLDDPPIGDSLNSFFLATAIAGGADRATVENKNADEVGIPSRRG